MEAIKKITTIRNGSISLKDLEALNNQEVEIIILPLIGQESSGATKTRTQKERLFQFEGAIESEFADTSTNIDKLIYDK
jgi:hypothetical protein